MINKILKDNNINPGLTKFVLCYDQIQDLMQQTVGETVLAVLAANIKDLQATTYDYQQTETARTKIVDAIRNHWKFK
jgi:hypothetical protein